MGRKCITFNTNISNIINRTCNTATSAIHITLTCQKSWLPCEKSAEMTSSELKQKEIFKPIFFSSTFSVLEYRWSWLSTNFYPLKLFVNFVFLSVLPSAISLLYHKSSWPATSISPFCLLYDQWISNSLSFLASLYIQELSSVEDKCLLCFHFL